MTALIQIALDPEYSILYSTRCGGGIPQIYFVQLIRHACNELKQMGSDRNKKPVTASDDGEKNVHINGKRNT